MFSEAKIKSLNFSFYTKKEIEAMSVVEITNPIAFDKLKNPWENGLYDQRMGANPYDRLSLCPICNAQEQECPGHMGHIKLVLPIYNLFLLKDLHKLLQAKCYYCHSFTITQNKKETFRIMLLLLNLNMMKEFQFYQDYNENFFLYKQKKTIKKKGKQEKQRKTSKSTNKSDDNSEFQQKENDFNQFMKEVTQKLLSKKKKIYQKLKNRIKDFDCDLNSYNQQIKNHLVKEFLKEAKNQFKCPKCDEMKPHIKKDGQSKFSIYFRKGQENKKKNTVISSESKYQLLNPVEIYNQLKQLFKVEKEITKCLFGKFKTNKIIKTKNPLGYEVKEFDPNFYFLEILPVTPNRFRPESMVNNNTYLHSQTVLYTKILQLNHEIKEQIIKNKKEFFEPDNKESDQYKKVFSLWLNLQETVNCLFDSSQNPKVAEKTSGIKQILEKKEGIFRMRIMGKRVNYCARSVISPDPNLETNEVGIPIFMAKKLTFPEPVNLNNLKMLQQAIINGSSNYPGALYIEENGVKRYLEASTVQQRETLAKRLSENCENKIVYRHVINGDIVLFNRQPTLHKPSLMSFKLRILPKELTIRMHYVNCSSFNADFDGDEMNVHVLQNYMAKAEGLYLSLSDKQFILATNKNPIRGLIQDFIFASVFITNKEMFFTKNEYCQYLYDALMVTIEEDSLYNRITLMKPAIVYPRQLWTGKQLISNIIDYLARYDQTGLNTKVNLLNMRKSARINKKYFCEIGKEEEEVLIKDNVIMKGVVDKNMIGAVSYGLVHCFYELFGSDKTKRLFSALSRLCMNYLKSRGFSCGLRDLILNKDYEKKRKDLMEEIHSEQIKKLEQFFNLKENKNKINFYENSNKKIEDSKKLKKISVQQNSANLLSKLSNKIQNFVNQNENNVAEIDANIKSAIANLQSSLYSNCLGDGLFTKFPNNNFSCMVLTGAKGSVLNHSQVSVNLGQQELEGKRVPVMNSGKTLPCWSAFDPNLRCGGFIGDRFLSGLRSQEFFFHCMAGREGLVDTAVKTSRSGYLQRILVKNLESLIVEYDYTVRDVDDQNLVQFYYGEDSLDSTKVNVLENLDFMLNNFKTLKSNLDEEKLLRILKQENLVKEEDNTLMNQFSPVRYFGAVSDKCEKELERFIKERKQEFIEKNVDFEEFKKMVFFQYFLALVNPGEAVGAIGAQSFGEPSTQMTLNTFHLAGHGGVNVTLGVPRLKEILTSKSTKNAIMMIPFKENVSNEVMNQFVRKFERVNLLELVQSITYKSKALLAVNNEILCSSERCYEYKLKIVFEDLIAIQECFGLSQKNLEKIVVEKFLSKFLKILQKLLKTKKVQINQKEQQNNNDNKNKKKFPQLDKNETGKSSNEIFDKNSSNLEEEILKNEYVMKNNKFLILLKVPLNSEKLHLIDIIEELMTDINIKKIKNIKNCHLINLNNKTFIQTEGINFKSFYKHQNLFQTNQLSINDIQEFTKQYGIEAGRNCLIKEVQEVFNHYGIKVDYRHCYLIGDHMCFNGEVNPMSRMGIQVSQKELKIFVAQNEF